MGISHLIKVLSLVCGRCFFYALATLILCSALLPTSPLNANGIATIRFSTDELTQWEEHSFEGSSNYRVVTIGGERVIRSDSSASASGLFQEMRINLERTPWVNWRWRIADVIGDPDERSKAGDDYPARVYVVKKGGLLPWRTRALNYVWSNNQREGEAWPNAFTDRSLMLALRSGSAQAGEWVTERRNVRHDFQRHFGEDIRHIDVVALMTDTDNTGGKATAWYGEIWFSAD
jgi:hypothetical protein